MSQLGCEPKKFETTKSLVSLGITPGATQIGRVLEQRWERQLHDEAKLQRQQSATQFSVKDPFLKSYWKSKHSLANTVLGVEDIELREERPSEVKVAV